MAATLLRRHDGRVRVRVVHEYDDTRNPFGVHNRCRCGQPLRAHSAVGHIIPGECHGFSWPAPTDTAWPWPTSTDYEQVAS